MRSRKPILLAEDDEVDVMSIQRAFKEINITNPLVVTTNGEDVLEYLKNPDNPVPCIILLDIKMPKMNGIEVLAVLKNDPATRKIPVVMLTTSDDEKDRIASFNHSVAGYMIKPVDRKKFIDIIKTIDMYWTLSELPQDMI